MGALAAVLIDVGGTLWTDVVEPDLGRASAERVRRVASVVGEARATEVIERLEERARPPKKLQGRLQVLDINAVVKAVVAELGLDGVDPVALRRAMSVPAKEFVTPPGDMRSFLERLGARGLRRVVVSNTVWRSADDFRDDFAAFGIADQIDAIVCSLDMLVRKPHPVMFQVAQEMAGTPLASMCVMIGDLEAKDIVPARAAGMLTIRMAPGGAPDSAAHAVVASLSEAAGVIERWDAEAPIFAKARAVHDGLQIHLANDSESERFILETLRRMLDAHDVSRYLFTDRVVIDDDAIAHSHPVLTIGTRFSVRTELGVLATLLHEQLHWHVHDDTLDASSDAAIEELRALYPSVPVGRAGGGANSEDSTYLHLIVNWLEHEALAAVVGREKAEETTRAQAVYRWIYGRVLEDHATIGDIVRRHGLALDYPSGP